MRRFLFTYTLAVLPWLACAAPATADTAGFSSHVQPLSSGEDVYRHVCQSCHMPDARGAVGAGAQFPALAGNPKLQSGAYPVYVILNGFGGMPWFAGVLDDTQIANVVNYVRTHFGNHYTDAVTPADVAAQHPAVIPQEE